MEGSAGSSGSSCDTSWCKRRLTRKLPHTRRAPPSPRATLIESPAQTSTLGRTFTTMGSVSNTSASTTSFGRSE
ncbi:hypothetical protein AG1IA_10442 [Rhizoctonia solani AG-1 IA]|uniref:Uncharacterized protein n=1 Tax=Thanatephorus cucumeris (strain AG1-IA) TaxID=983506 RepID=L8WFG5_THACA|nr:hypothetical protein AG1IA_10442 [Rhizoctonia solani AG-1 IA]